MIDSLLDFLQIELRLWFLSVILRDPLSTCKDYNFWLHCKCMILWGTPISTQIDVWVWLELIAANNWRLTAEMTRTNTAKLVPNRCSTAPTGSEAVWCVPPRHLRRRTGWIHPDRGANQRMVWQDFSSSVISQSSKFRHNFAAKLAVFTPHGASRCAISIHFSTRRATWSGWCK